jgi:hypothetical protein
LRFFLRLGRAGSTAHHRSRETLMATPLPDNPFVTTPFELDVDAFMAAIEPAPAFLRDPSPEFLTAIEFKPIVEVLTAYQ